LGFQLWLSLSLLVWRNTTFHGIIYAGGFHFSAHMLDFEGVVWQYDDRVNDGQPSYNLAVTDHRTSSLTGHAWVCKLLTGHPD
jgi:hypothetical protein